MSASSGMSALRHLSPEILDRPELQLFHRALTAAEFAGDLADAFLFDKAHVNHAKLRLREPVYQLEQHGAAFDFFGTRPVGIQSRIPRFAPAALPVAGDGPRGDPQ